MMLHEIGMALRDRRLKCPVCYMLLNNYPDTNIVT